MRPVAPRGRLVFEPILLRVEHRVADDVPVGQEHAARSNSEAGPVKRLRGIGAEESLDLDDGGTDAIEHSSRRGGSRLGRRHRLSRQRLRVLRLRADRTPLSILRRCGSGCRHEQRHGAKRGKRRVFVPVRINEGGGCGRASAREYHQKRLRPFCEIGANFASRGVLIGRPGPRIIRASRIQRRWPRLRLVGASRARRTRLVAGRVPMSVAVTARALMLGKERISRRTLILCDIW